MCLYEHVCGCMGMYLFFFLRVYLCLIVCICVCVSVCVHMCVFTIEQKTTCDRAFNYIFLAQSDQHDSCLGSWDNLVSIGSWNNLLSIRLLQMAQESWYP